MLECLKKAFPHGLEAPNSDLKLDPKTHIICLPNLPDFFVTMSTLRKIASWKVQTVEKPKVSLPKLSRNQKFQFVPSTDLVTSCAEQSVLGFLRKIQRSKKIFPQVHFPANFVFGKFT